MSRVKALSRFRPLWPGLGLACAVFIAWFPFRNAGFSDNEGTYTSISQELERGAELYRNAWDNKPPLLYTQFLAVRKFLGTTPFALRCYVLFIQLLNAALLFLLLRKVGFKDAAPWGAAFAYAAFTSSPNFQPWLAEADLLMLPFLLGAFCCACSSGRRVWTLAGALWAGAFFTKQSALFFLPAFIPLLLKDGRPLGRFAFFALGSLVGGVLVLAPFLLDGRVGMLLSALFGMGHGMSGAYLKDGWDQFFSQDFTRENILFMVLATAVAVYGVPLLLTGLALADGEGDRRDRSLRCFLLLWLLAGLWGCAIRGYFLTYYFIALLPPLAMGFALGARRLRPAVPVLFGLCLAWLGLFLVFNVWKTEAVRLDTILGFYRNKDYFRDEPRQVAAALDETAHPGDKLLAWCYEPEIYTYSGLGYSQIKTIWLYQLGKSQEELDSIQKAFLSRPPRFIVLHNYRESPPPPDWLQPFVDSAYERLPDAGGYQLYCLKPDWKGP